MTAEYFWLFSFLASSIWAVASIIDNYVLSNELKNPVSYDILTTWLASGFAGLIYFTTRVSYDPVAYTAGIGVGLSFAFLYVLYDFGMMQEDAPSVISVIYTLPLYVAVLSWVILRESLGNLDYAGIVLLTFSAIIVSYRRISKRNLALVFVFVFAIGTALTRIVSKSALGTVDVWSFLFWTVVGQNIGAFFLIARPKFRRGLVSSVSKLQKRTFFLLGATTVFTFLGYALFYSAISLGSVSLATGITALQPSVVLLYSFGLTRIRPTALPAGSAKGGKQKIRKVIAVLLIAVGTWLMLKS